MSDAVNDQSVRARPLRDRDFGSRYLKDQKTVYKYNAWDDVDFPPEQEQIVQEAIDMQKKSAVDEDKAAMIVKQPVDQWNNFYSTHCDKFFMDRNWLTREAPELFHDGTPVRISPIYYA